MGVARTAVTRDKWLHVSAFQRYDLGPARARGLKTCLLRRPGGDEKAPCDLVVEGLEELVALTAAAKKGPVLLEISNQADGKETRDRLRSWLVDRRMPMMRQVPGVRDGRVVEADDGQLHERYIFGGQHEYEAYVEAFEAEHRAAVRQRFGEKVVRESRTVIVRGRA